jgi:DNA-binding transcriptional MerR regulator/methylmalonyl-CoA mutase cobalamin-binding subunit
VAEARVLSTIDPAPLGRDIEDPTVRLTIQQASALVQVPAPTIRSWERRYGVPRADRSQGGHRRYTLEQVRVLRRMRDAIAQGQSAAQAAKKVLTVELSSHQPLIEQFVAAAHRLDPHGMTRVLDSARTSSGLDRTLDEVLFPSLQRIGRSWAIGQCDVSHEHLATETTSAWLSQVSAEPSSRSAPVGPVILACGPRDHHTLGLESLAALLRERGCDCRPLGARVPALALVTAIEETHPAAIVLVSHVSVARRSAVDAMRSLPPGHAPLFYAGNAFRSRQARVGVPGTYLGESVSAAADVIMSATTEPAAGAPAARS